MGRVGREQLRPRRMEVLPHRRNPRPGGGMSKTLDGEIDGWLRVVNGSCLRYRLSAAFRKLGGVF